MVEALLDLSELMIKEVIGQLKAIDNRRLSFNPTATCGKLLLTQE